MFESILIVVGVLSPIVLGVTEAIKKTGDVQSRYIPFVSMGVGVVLGFVYNYVIATGDTTLVQYLFAGFLAGLSASGLYSTINTPKKA